MLRFLKLRKDDPEIQPPWGELSVDQSDAGESDTDVMAVKKPKDDKVIIEELRCLTGELQEHIMQLVKESEVDCNFIFSKGVCNIYTMVTNLVSREIKSHSKI